MLKNFKEGDNITILNTMYLYPRKQENGKWDKGSISIVYKNLDNGKKYVETIDDPEIEYYVLNEGETAAKNALFIEENKVTKVSAKYRNIEKDIAERTGNLEFFKTNIYNGNRSANKRLHAECTNIFNSDMNIDDFTRYKFNLLYQNNAFKPTKAYFDIEADVIDQAGDFPEMGECPINAITYIDVEHMCIFTFLLRNKDNPLIQEFEDNVNDDMYNELKAFIRERVGGEKNELKYGLNNMKYKMLFYDEEIQLINDFFTVINTSKPDFLLAWNMAFDIPYIIQRIYNLGYDAAQIMCHNDFKYKYVNYYIDTRADEITERGDYCKISSYTVFLDQMIQFASRRKASKGAFANWKLDYIGDETVGIRKLDYSHITTSLAKLPYMNYKVFVFYNIMDTIVQYCIEHKVGDVDYLFNKCLINNTRYEKGHRQTVYLVNRATKEFKNEGLIIGNNKNKFNPKPTEKFPGAHVADPKKINPYSKYKTYGLPIMVFENLDDFDYSAMYPSIINEFNLAPNTQIGKIKIPNKIYENENPFGSEMYSREGAFIEDFHSHNFIEFCQRWFNLAGYKELCEDIDYYFNKIQNSYYIPYKNYKGKRILLHYDNHKNTVKHVLIYPNSQGPLMRNNKMPDINDIRNIDVTKIVYGEE